MRTMPDAPEVAQALRETAAWMERRSPWCEPRPLRSDPYFTPGGLHGTNMRVKRLFGMPVGFCPIGYAADRLGILTFRTDTTELINIMCMGQTPVRMQLRRVHVAFDDHDYSESRHCVLLAARLLDPPPPVKRRLWTPHSHPERVLARC